MADESQVRILEQGAEVWNDWRRKHPLVAVELSDADLSYLTLNGANLKKSDLNGANLNGTELENADLEGADLAYASLRFTELKNANLRKVDLGGAILIGTELEGADLHGAFFEFTVFADLNLSNVHSLDSVTHTGPSTLGLDTFLLSDGNIPDSFLVGCGVQDQWIDYLPSLLEVPIDLFSSFISHSHQDGEFCKTLYERMRADKLRVWFAPEDIQGGKKIHEQIDQAIRIHDKLLIVLSEHSMKSEWVKTEIRQARKREDAEGRQVLFPIRLVSMKAIKNWVAFDADTGKDMAVEIREYHIPDFRGWKKHDTFQESYQRLMEDLKPSSGG